MTNAGGSLEHTLDAKCVEPRGALPSKRTPRTPQEGDEPMMTLFRYLEDRALNQMSVDERVRYVEALDAEELRFNVAERLHRARTEVGMSQTQLAGRAGISRSTVAAIESGARTPSILTLQRVARAMDLTLNIGFAHGRDSSARTNPSPSAAENRGG